MNLLITGAWGQAKNYIEEIENQGHIVKFMKYEKDELPCSYEWVQGVICNGVFLYHPIEKFINLKYIQLTSAGYDRIPLEYIKEKNIEIHNARGVYSVPMAEFAIGGVLQLYKRFDFFKKNQNEHKWLKSRELDEIYEKKVCIIGCGNVGTECAKRFNAFGCKVIGVDVKNRFDVNYEEIYTLEQFKDILCEIDILIITLPLTNETKNLIDKEIFTRMKKGAIFVNISRGGVVKKESLMIALKEKLGGAVLDVFDEEPLDEHDEIWDMQNVLISPHNSFVGKGNEKRLFLVIKDNLERRDRR